MILMNGKKLQIKMLASLKQEADILIKNGPRPKLVIVQIGDNPSSTIYIKHKQKACESLGIASDNILLPASTTLQKLQEVLAKLNNDQTVDAILVQFPLPPHLSKRQVSLLIDPAKDADGIHPLNQGVTLTNTNTFAPQPCTPKGVIALLQAYDVELKNKHAVVIGRSNIAGRPMSNMLINHDATVSLLHSHTDQATKKALLKTADIIVSATGSKNVFAPDDVKAGVVIVDVGIIKEGSKIRGDVDYQAFSDVASKITPVPGGVGPMTVAMLMANVINIVKHK